MKYYLAYGSNLNVAQMAHRCPTAAPLGKAYINGYELLFKGSKTGSYLTIEPKPGGEVPVIIWEITPEDEKRLDIYEGFPTFYYKKDFKIGDLDCFAYIMHENRPLGTPSCYYVETCLNGYGDWCFDEMYLWQALQKSTRRRA